MYLKKIFNKVSPTYRKLNNSIDPKLDLIVNNLGNIESRIEQFAKNDSIYKKFFYSQDGEDAVLASFYEEKQEYIGFYVDIGALHPLRFSNTQYFYEKGWRGINIDALPGSMIEFNKLRPRDINIESGISSDGKSFIYYSFKEAALNSFDKKISEERVRNGWALLEKIEIKTQSINCILSKYLPKGQDIDFMNIDVEGFEFDILKSLDWEKYHPEYLLIEDLDTVEKDSANYGDSDLYKFLKNKGYAIVARTKRTIIFKFL